MRKQLEFPRTYTTSSAANRVIYQLKAKGDTRDFIMTKEGEKVFKVSVKEKISLEDFLERFRNIERGESTYRYFPDGVHGEGFYELKKGDRRRPNSLFVPVNEVFEEFNNQ